MDAAPAIPGSEQSLLDPPDPRGRADRSRGPDAADRDRRRRPKASPGSEAQAPARDRQPQEGPRDAGDDHQGHQIMRPGWPPCTQDPNRAGWKTDAEEVAHREDRPGDQENGC